MEWFAKRKYAVGGSELSAIIGWNRYSSYERVLAEKAGLVEWDGGIACHWGMMFEYISERIVEIDCETVLLGSDVRIDGKPFGFPGHANSPDGYCVINMIRKNNAHRPDAVPGDWEILFSDQDIPREQSPLPVHDITSVAVLLELKAPYRRRPTKAIPRYYLPQLWSGLSLSPFATFALFVEVVYRICSVFELGPSGRYNSTYHPYDAAWGGAYAWGVTAVFSPEPSKDVHRMGCDYFGHELPQTGAASGVGLIDFGECSAGLFNQMMSYINQKYFVVQHIGPCFADGRGAWLDHDSEDGGLIKGLDDLTNPRDMHLLGFIPWKVFDINYIPETRHPVFLRSCQPDIDRLNSDAHAVRSSEKPTEAYSAACQKHRELFPKRKPREMDSPGPNECPFLVEELISRV